MGTETGSGSKVVVHYLDGRLLKGTTRDFSPNKPEFHVHPDGDESAEAVKVTLAPLKAIFFVKTFQGSRDRQRDNSFIRSSGQGRRILVIFKDGEAIAGFTTGYAPDRPGFFLIPADHGSNNLRIFAVTTAVKKVEWVSVPAPVPTGSAGR